MRNPNQKGGAFERLVAKRLSLWLTTGRRDDCLWRTAMSGGRATFQLKRDIVNRAQAGDLTAISAEAFALCERHLVEVKHYKDLNFTALVTSGAGLLAGFWRATQKTAARLDKLPILIAKQNHYPTVVLCPVACGLFARAPEAVFPLLGAELHWFEPATEVVRLRIKRPITLKAAE